MAAGTANQTYNLYKSVIDEVIKNVKDAFQNEGHDEKVIQELRNAWEHRLKDSDAVRISKNEINIPDTSSAMYPHNTIPKAHPPPHLPMPSSSGSLVENFRSGRDDRVHVRELEGHSRASSLYRMKHPLQQPHHPMHSYPPNSFMHSPPMFLSHPIAPISQHFEKFESSFGSPEDKPTKENLSGYKTEGKRQQTDQSMYDKVPSAKRSRIGQIDGNGGGQGTGGSGTAATGGADVIEYSSDDDTENDLDDDQSDNSEIATGELDSSGVVRKGDGAKGIGGGDVESGKHPEGIEGDEELGSTDDDESGDDHEDHFETENMVVCQFKKVTRTRNKWRFHLKDGIMNLNGIDQVFSQATGEADW